MKQLLLFFACALILSGCSGAHQIHFSVPQTKDVENKQHFAVALCIPDSLKNFIYGSTITGGLCKGHDYDLHIGNGLMSAMLQSFGSMYDSVLMMNAEPNPSEIASHNIAYIVTPKIEHMTANTDFSQTSFFVQITTNVDENLIFQSRNTSDNQTSEIHLHTSGDATGKAQDCHDAVPYIKQAGDAAMLHLRDTIITEFHKNFMKGR